jgi:hypothetical protein
MLHRPSDLDGFVDKRPIYLVQDWDQWRALVNTVMNLQVLCNIAKFLST